ncbi:exonuclease 3'-5' domain-containing protein 2-like [Acipenser ruthenus]|uniref:exonuclease 3'-5' domain-containing protein 2-like n=1 Tax=Acipenser ruthenus TaxID=7906 RepID=UPI00145B3B8C|nr:exonuclease 3'-5' domain-containing protein 2-like [Acipenser ruthenus]
MSRQSVISTAVLTLLGTTLGGLVIWKAVKSWRQKISNSNHNGELGKVRKREQQQELEGELEGVVVSEHSHWPSLPLAEQLLKVEPALVSCADDWEEVWPAVQRELGVYPVLGIDCEWVSVKGKAGPVALLQMSTFSGLCVAIRLLKFRGDGQTVPRSLLDILQDDSILKAGVGCYEDACRLMRDYGITVNCTVDLRYLAMRQRRTLVHNGLSLKSLAQDILNLSLDKSLQLRCSNWEAEELSQEQVTYAGRDAQVSVALFFHLLGLVSMTTPEGTAPDSVCKQLLAKCQGLVDVPFKGRGGGGGGEEDGGALVSGDKKLRNRRTGSDSKATVDGQAVDPRKHKRKPLGVGYSARKSPLYDNCFLHAPDGQPLCTCDKKKAKWYLDKGIGELLSEDPFIVKLKFEPSGRPESQQDYYLTAKENICVVCGRTESYIRKNIVPHEYRRHFPIQMKDHNSHDVLLLCTSCHAASNYHDNLLKQQLSEEHSAPLGCEEGVRPLEDPDRRQVRSGARALLKADSLPESRREELLGTLRTFYSLDEVTPALLQEAAGLETRIFNESYIPHGLKVVQAYTKGGLRSLMELEKRWRQHFLTSMQPRHIPPLWSVEHNHSKLLRKYGEDLEIQLT